MIKELSIEKELEIEKNLIWIFGNDFDGNNWMAELLASETNAFREPRIAEHLAVLVGTARPKLVRRIDDYKKYDSFFFSNKYKKIWIRFLRKLVIGRVYAQIKDNSKKILIQESRGVGASDILTECLPESKMIMLVRDPIDTIQNMIKNIPDERLRSVDERRLFISIQIDWWLKLIQNFLDAKHNNPQNKLLIIKFEKLLNDTNSELKKVLNFLDIQIEQNVLKQNISNNPFKPKNQKSEEDFSRNFKYLLTAEEISLINNKTSEYLKEINNVISNITGA